MLSTGFHKPGMVRSTRSNGDVSRDPRQNVNKETNKFLVSKKHTVVVFGSRKRW